MKKIKKNLKDIVRDKYGEIAQQSRQKNESSCCGATSCCGEGTYTIFSDDYSGQKGYNPEADLGLGCGVPTEFANIKKGDTVLDLGSGAGNDCFVAHSLTGTTGKVIGLDFTDEMIHKANENKKKMGLENLEFIKGDIEDMPLADDSIDVVISNCVLNLVPDKDKAFSEIFRILKDGGHFCVSDVVIQGTLPDVLKKDAEMYAGCVAGAIDMSDYTNIIEKQGFQQLTIHKKKEIDIPAEILSNYLSKDEIVEFKHNKTGIFSITVSASKQIKHLNNE